MNPNTRLALGALAATVLSAPLSHAAVKAEVARSATDKGFKLDPVPVPSRNDAATGATFRLVDGELDRNGGDLKALHDGQVPFEEDEPSKNLFFQNGTNGGRIEIDLGKTTSIKSVNTYSWHKGARAAQSYKLYGAKGDEKNFGPAPKREIDPRTLGWTPVAKVDTRRGDQGGQHAALVRDAKASTIGQFRYLLLDFEAPDSGNSQSNTFLSEIDVVAADGPAPEPFIAKVLKTYPSPDGKYKYIVDSTLAPDLDKWVEKELMPVVYEWYPKMVAMLPSDRYTAPETVIMEFRDDLNDGTPAYALGNKLCMNTPWFRKQLEGEAKGCVIHELVHIIQNYWRARSVNPNATDTPGWVVEGIPDYVRWFVYEPKTKGAEIHKDNFANAKYSSSYRISANFLNWVVETHDKEFVRKLNAAARDGKYSDKVWKDATGKTVEELGEDWKAANAKRLGI